MGDETDAHKSSENEKNLQTEKQQVVTQTKQPPAQPEAPKMNMPDIVPSVAVIEKPSQPVLQEEDSGDSDLDGEEIINTNLQTATVGTVHAPSSSDTESENEPETDNKHRDSD